MDLLFIKLTLTPLLMAGVSLASRRWGGAVGGLLAGLPLTAAPVSIYLTIEQGHAFTALMAVSAIGGIGAVTLSYLVYIGAGRRLPIAATMALAALSFLLASALLRALELPLGLVLALDGLLIATAFMRNRQAAETRVLTTYTVWDLPARILVSTAMVLAITFSARIIGPRFSGLLSTVPMIGWPLIVFAHKQQGYGEAVLVAFGIMRGVLGLIAFYLVVDLLLPTRSALATFPLALAVSLAVTAGWVWQRRLAPKLVR